LGQPVVGGVAALDLSMNGHVAKFMEELFPDADLRGFKGTLSVSSDGGNIIGTALSLGQKKGEITALPVTPIR
jgi:hypothetical protein